jgi:preprotein translocase subunit SecY
MATVVSGVTASGLVVVLVCIVIFLSGMFVSWMDDLSVSKFMD